MGPRFGFKDLEVRGGFLKVTSASRATSAQTVYVCHVGGGAVGRRVGHPGGPLGEPPIGVEFGLGQALCLEKGGPDYVRPSEARIGSRY
jgi:hypothetical protein